MYYALPLRFLIALSLQFFLLSMGIMVYYYDRQNRVNRWFSVTTFFMVSWNITGGIYMFFPVPVYFWVALQMISGSAASASFYFFARNIAVPRYKANKIEQLMWLPPAYIFGISILRIFIPEFSLLFADKVSVINNTLLRQTDIHYIVYTIGFMASALTGLISMAQWIPHQTDSSKKTRLVSVFFSFIILFAMLLIFNSIANLIGKPLNPNFSIAAFFVSMLWVAISLMRDKAWKIEHLLEIIKKNETALTAEKALTDKLLLNILPKEVADELKQTGKVQPVLYDSVSVLFSDFVGFTHISESMTPKELVSKLDMYFSEFDKITESRGIEKLKTIGDSYMCAGGIPNTNRTHTVDIILAALEILNFVQTRGDLNIRIGIHTGSLAAGIVGEKKFVYDIWGDTVNIASRMESSGIENSINISEALKNIVNNFFEVEDRGGIYAKNKGMMQMYLVKGIKKELSEDGKGIRPNEDFFRLRDFL